MAVNLTVGELQTAKLILAHEIESAVAAVLTDPNIRFFSIGRFVFDFEVVLAASRVATMILKDVHANDRHKRIAIRTAILLARPDKP